MVSPFAEGAISFKAGKENECAIPAPTHSTWVCLWKTRPANPVAYLAFSPDGTLFATAGRNDRLVRVWYQNQQRECSVLCAGHVAICG